MSRYVLLALAVVSGTVFGQGVLHDPEDQVIHYNSPDHLIDRVSKLQESLLHHEATLEFEAAHGYLASLLKLLKVPVSSQALVFSRTSLHPDKVSPSTPRAVYFNDDVYISWIPGGELIDLLAVDPDKGPIFYVLSQRQSTDPRFTRSNDCANCHLGPRTLGVPGPLVRSVITKPNGDPLFQVDGFMSGHGSPLNVSWGGWYVTGTLTADTHMGNSVWPDSARSERIYLTEDATRTELRPRFDTARYLSTHSDIVSLMVLAHQVKMQNLITRANYETRFALDPRMAAQNPNWAQQRIANAAEPLLEYLLFRDEAALHGPVKGSSSFAEEFQQGGPRDFKGRSLRELNLDSRLMSNSCSYLIYSPAFDALLPPMKNYLWQRLSDILSGKDQSKAYAAMSIDDKKAVFEILRETKPEFAAWLRR